MTVTRLIDRANGVPAPDFTEWLEGWCSPESLAHARTVILVVERQDGTVHCAPQSTIQIDGFRLVGILEALKVRITQGKGIGW